MLKPLRNALRLALVVTLAFGGLVAADSLQPQSAQAIGEDTFTNPLAPDTADPTIEYYNGNYYLVATTWDNKVVMRKAPTLEALGTTKPVTVYSDTNQGRNGNMWAPELQRLEGPNGWRWYLMYTMGVSGDFGTQHLQVIESASDDPMGPYTYKGRPLAIDDWNIDGAYMELNDELFMTWSQFSPDGLQSNYIARMSNPWTATGPLNILSQPVEPWEVIGQPVNEGPIPLQHDGRTWITYSASFCGTADYQLGTLEYMGGDPVLSDSWQKSDGPVFSQANGAYGTGHNDFFTSPDGTEIWNLYHANARPDGGCSRERSARAQLVTWDADGEPNFGVPLSTSTEIPVPSGENDAITADIEGARWNLVSRGTGECVAAASDTDGEQLVSGDCASAQAQFVLDTTGDGYLRIVNAESDLAVGPAECAVESGVAATQTAFTTKGCQQWSVAQSSDGWSTLTNRTSELALSAELTLTTPDGSAAQDWALRPAGSVVVTSIVSGKALELASCSTDDGASLQQAEFTDAACQSILFTAAENGESEMHVSTAPDKCLAVDGGSTADSVAVTLGACGITGSTWRILVSGDGVVEFRNGNSGKALDLSFCSTEDGTPVHQYSVLNNDCQRFRIASVDDSVAPPVQLTAMATTRCVAGNVVIATTVHNAGDTAANATVTAAGFGTKSLHLESGQGASASFSTRTGSVAEGSVQVSGDATLSASYPARTC